MHLFTNKNIANKKLYLIIPLVILLLILVLFEMKYGDHISFYRKWNECGRKPIATMGPGFFHHEVRHYYEPPAFSWIAPNNYEDYYCTPLEAEKARYSANPNSYEFPHLEKQK